MIIEVKNLSKKYHIARQRGGGYVALRDVLTNVMKSPFRFIKKRAERVLDREDKEEFWALKDINFNVEQGEVLGIIGANGAGKSTLLKILSRITPPTEGEVRMRGRVSSLLEVGTGFHPELTGRENIFLNGAILGMTRKEISRKFDEIVDFSGIEKFLDTPIKRYSSGMQVRLAFSVAAHLEPEILLVDEVLAVGDAEFQKKSLGKMEDVTKKEGRTILFVSHNMTSILNLCHKTILLDSGKVLMYGLTANVVEFYMGLKREDGFKFFCSDPSSAPGDEFVRLQKVCLLSVDKKPVSKVDIDKDFFIEISYWNLKEGAKLYTSIQVVDVHGIAVLMSFNGHSANSGFDSWYDRERPKGLFRTLCKIPGIFLNEGVYFINVFIGSFTGRMIAHVKKEQIISFEIIDNGIMRKEYSGKWIGVVRPKLDWSTEYEKIFE